MNLLTYLMLTIVISNVCDCTIWGYYPLGIPAVLAAQYIILNIFVSGRFCFVNGGVYKQKRKRNESIRIFTLDCVISTIEPVIRRYHCTRTRNISLSSHTIHLYGIAGCLQRAGTTARSTSRGWDLSVTCHIATIVDQVRGV